MKSLLKCTWTVCLSAAVCLSGCGKKESAATQENVGQASTESATANARQAASSVVSEVQQTQGKIVADVKQAAETVVADTQKQADAVVEAAQKAVSNTTLEAKEKVQEAVSSATADANDKAQEGVAKAQNLIEQAKALVTQQKYRDALTIINQVAQLTLTPEQQKQLNDLKVETQKMLENEAVSGALKGIGGLLRK